MRFTPLVPRPVRIRGHRFGASLLGLLLLLGLGREAQARPAWLPIPLPTADPITCGVTAEFPLPNTTFAATMAFAPMGGTYCTLIQQPPPHLPLPRAGLGVIVLLHGLGGSPADYWRADRSTLAQQLYDAMARGDLPPALVVAPNGAKGYWTNWDDGAHPYDDQVMDGLFPWLEFAFPIAPGPSRVAIMGLSMGGFGALSLGLRHPERVGAMVGFSPTDMVMAAEDSPKRKVYRQVFGTPIDMDRTRRHNPTELVQNGAGIRQLMVLAVGAEEDRKFLSGAKNLADALEGKGIDHHLHISPGGRHDYLTTWSAAQWDVAILMLGNWWRSGRGNR